MKIHSVSLQNWLIHRAFAANLDALSIIGGPNESGKSSIRDGISFALTSELCRVALKGDRPNLISSGAEKGSAGVEIGDGEIVRDIATGKVKSFKPIGAIEGIDLANVFPLLLDPARFSGASPDARRLILTHVMGVRRDAETVTEMLAARGLDPAIISGWSATKFDQEGFAWAHAAALEEAKSARASWKGVTGETYGEVKAATWTAAPAEPPNGERITDDEVQVAQAEVRRIVGEIATIRAQRAAEAALETRQHLQREQAARIPALEAELAEIKAKQATEANAVRAPRAAGETETTCPECGSVFVIGKDKQAVAPAAATSLFDGKTRQSEVERLLTIARQAKVLLEEEAGMTFPVENKSLDELKAMQDQAETAARVKSALFTAWAVYEAASKAVDIKTKNAAAYHAQAVAASQLADALAPAGIQAELLAKVLDPFNALLAKFSARALWPVVAIDPDMNITLRGRPYGLNSESAKWRADLIIATAIAVQSGIKFVVADRFDVLDPSGRKQAVLWLRSMVKQDEIDSAILLGTFKEKPVLPQDIKVIWLGEEKEISNAAKQQNSKAAA